MNISAVELSRSLKRNELGKDEAREAELLSQFPPGEEETIDQPALIIDRDGVVLAWYLPSVLGQDRQVRRFSSHTSKAHLFQTKISEALVPITDALMKSYNSVTTGWRSDRDFFSETDGILKGCLNMSPAWFQMGHGGGDNLPEVSATLKSSNASAGGCDWLELNAETNALLAAAMAIMHPELYQAGTATMAALPDEANAAGVEEIAEVVGKWDSVFNAVSVMINRQSPYHRDPNSPQQSFDLLATFGDYPDGWMVIPTIGKRFDYRPGTVMAFSGHLLRHGVNEVNGNRGCLAYYMRPAVMKWVGVKPPSFMRYEVLDVMGLTRDSHRVYVT